MNKKIFFILIFLLSSCYPLQEAEKEVPILDSTIEATENDDSLLQLSAVKTIEFESNLIIPDELSNEEEKLFNQLLEKVTSFGGRDQEAIAEYASDNGIDEEWLWGQWIELSESIQFQTHGNYPTMASDLINLSKVMIEKNIKNENYEFKNVRFDYDTTEKVAQVDAELIIDESLNQTLVRFKLSEDYQKAKLIELTIGEEHIVSEAD